LTPEFQDKTRRPCPGNRHNFPYISNSTVPGFEKRPGKNIREPDSSATPSPHATIEQLRELAAGCQACPLWKRATQTVFGEGPPRAEIMLVGEQPGDSEDLAGRPFVGPAGEILNRALAESAIERQKVYVTNVVKHFKWMPRGKRRIHETPRAAEIQACLPWLYAEIDRVQPKILVCLGATAAKALLGSDFRVSRQRGERVSSDLAPNVMATVHPSSLLRIKEKEERDREIEHFIRDMTKAAGLLK
jgi:uracil-DNA glycosylase